MTRNDLGADEYNSYYQRYIDSVGDIKILDALRRNHKSIISFIRSIEEDKLCYRYAEGKWSIKEIMLHLIDTERVFTYRALRISRHDKTELPGFDQDAFIIVGHENHHLHVIKERYL